MKLEKVRIRNYKSIADSGFIDISKQFTILVGKNNVGKTAFIEALSKCFGAKLTPGKPERGTRPCRLDVSITLESRESDSLRGQNLKLTGEHIVLSFQADLINGNVWFTGLREALDETSTGLLTNVGGQVLRQYDNLFSLYDRVASQSIYIFSNRKPKQSNQVKGYTGLDTEATNLHCALHALQSNKPPLFDEIEANFKELFPEVEYISTPVIDNNGGMVETNIALKLEHVSDPVALHDCGSGFTQTLILLYLLFTDENRLILLDEPHSFLHPSAEKAIYNLAANHPNHRFIFASHSPILINSSLDKNLYLVTKEGGKSKFSLLADVSSALSDIGISNSDYALSEKIIFVEGPTEENTIPLILERHGMAQLGRNYTVIGLNGTGKEFSMKAASEINAGVLETLLKRIAVAPIPYHILLDRDNKSDELMHKLTERYGGHISFLERCELENYLLVPEAIAAVLNGLGLDDDVSEEGIENKISDCLGTAGGATVKGSDVLAQVFKDYLVEYSKVYHGQLIVRWLLNNNQGDLGEIADLLKPFVAGDPAK